MNLGKEWKSLTNLIFFPGLFQQAMSAFVVYYSYTTFHIPNRFFFFFFFLHSIYICLTAPLAFSRSSKTFISP